MKNNERPLVTAIITTYKRKPAILSRAIESVLSQTYTNLELIVVDDSPADYDYRADVKTLCEGYGTRLRYIPHATNQGACAARNTGIDAANGDFIGFLDDDDEWLPAKIEKQIKLFDSDKIGLVYCDFYAVDRNTTQVKRITRSKHTGMAFDELISSHFIGSTSFPLLRRAAVVEVGKFDVNMPAAQDYDLWLRIAQKYEISCVNEPLGNYCMHSGEQISKDVSKKIVAYQRIYQKHFAFLKRHPRIRAIRLFAEAPYHFRANNWLVAIKLWLFAFCIYPFAVKHLYRSVKVSIMHMLRSLRG